MNGLLKTALAGILVVFVVLFVTTTFVPPPAAEYEQAKQYFTVDEIATGLQFAFERRLFFWSSTALELGLLLALTATGRGLADFFGRWTGYRAGTTTRLPAAVGGSGCWPGPAIFCAGSRSWC